MSNVTTTLVEGGGAILRGYDTHGCLMTRRNENSMASTKTGYKYCATQLGACRIDQDAELWFDLQLSLEKEPWRVGSWPNGLPIQL